MENLKIEEVARLERIEYFKKWRINNKDKVSKHNKNYWEKKARERMQKGGEVDEK